MKPGDLELGLLTALLKAKGAEFRWGKRKLQGMGDEQLPAIIGEEFGYSSGSKNPVPHIYAGGKEPKFILDPKGAGRRVLEGKELVQKVRGILGIPYVPVGACLHMSQQLSLFA